MTAPHLWVRAEQRDNGTRVGITPEGVTALMEQGFRVTVEASDSRVIATDAYAATGCTIAPQNSWPDAPADAIIFGLKELPEDGTPLVHRHIMFGHAYKGQSAGRILLQRFKAGGGTLLDLEYLTDETGRRVAAFGYPRILRSLFFKQIDMAMQPEPVPTSTMVEFLFKDKSNVHSTISSVSGLGINTLEST